MSVSACAFSKPLAVASVHHVRLFYAVANPASTLTSKTEKQSTNYTILHVSTAAASYVGAIFPWHPRKIW